METNFASISFQRRLVIHSFFKFHLKTNNNLIRTFKVFVIMRSFRLRRLRVQCTNVCSQSFCPLIFDQCLPLNTQELHKTQKTCLLQSTGETKYTWLVENME